jgi:hypothetical protein
MTNALLWRIKPIGHFSLVISHFMDFSFVAACDGSINGKPQMTNVQMTNDQ